MGNCCCATAPEPTVELLVTDPRSRSDVPSDRDENNNVSHADAEAVATSLLEQLLVASSNTVSLPVLEHAQRIPSGSRGFSLAFLRALTRFLTARGASGLDMEAVCKQPGLAVNVCNMTASTGLSLVESCALLAAREGLDTAGLFGSSSTFFSYSWTGSVLGDVSAAVQRGVRRLDEEAPLEHGGQRFVWLDMLCASQNLLAGTYAGRKEDTDNLFDGALEAASEIIFFLSPLTEEWDAPPHPYLRDDRGEPPMAWRRKGPRAASRAWCLFELATMLGRGARLVVELRPADHTALQTLLETRVGVMAELVTALDVSDAQVSKERDRPFIVGRIEAAGGFDRVNVQVKGALRGWLTQAAREALRDAEARAGVNAEARLLDLVNGLAMLLEDQGNYSEAEPLYWRMLKQEEMALGAEHPNTLTSANNLANLLAEQGKHAEAEPLFRRALEGFKKAYGAEHPHTLMRMNNLALLLAQRGKHDEAEPLHRRALEGCEKVLGAEHPDTLGSVNGLAALLDEQHKYAEAEPLYRRALQGQEKVLGSEHPHTLSSVSNLARLLAQQGKHAEAEPLCHRALEGFEKALGPAAPPKPVLGLVVQEEEEAAAKSFPGEHSPARAGTTGSAFSLEPPMPIMEERDESEEEDNECGAGAGCAGISDLGSTLSTTMSSECTHEEEESEDEEHLVAAAEDAEPVAPVKAAAVLCHDAKERRAAKTSPRSVADALTSSGKAYSPTEPQPTVDATYDKFPPPRPQPQQQHEPEEQRVPPLPLHPLGDTPALPDMLPLASLLSELQACMCSTESDLKRLLVRPTERPNQLQCDVLRVGKGNTYKCFLRLVNGRSNRRVCIFEASRSSKGRHRNSQYRITLPKDDYRFDNVGAADQTREEQLACGKVRSYTIAGGSFIAYDDGVKLEDLKGHSDGRAARQQLAAFAFSKSTSRRVPMQVRVLLPRPGASAPRAQTAGAANSAAARHAQKGELLEALHAIPNAHDAADAVPPAGTALLKLVPPSWNGAEGMFQLSYEGRAAELSNKNLQLADVERPQHCALQVGKLRENLFNVDFGGGVSPFQAFAAALAVFDQSSVRRRF